MTAEPLPPAAEALPVARLAGVTQAYGRTKALDDCSLDIPAGRLAGLIGPDGVGKSTLMSLVAGARALQSGRIEVLGGDMARAHYRRAVSPRIAFMPQGLGRGLYPTLSVRENIEFFARLFGEGSGEIDLRIRSLAGALGLLPFLDRPAGKLSGGMKQKLGLCCALIHDPDLLLLDEPTTGVDPLSRRQFWDVIAAIRGSRPEISILVATAYMEEAAHFEWLAALQDGKVLAQGSPGDILVQTASSSLEAAFIALLPEEQRQDYRPVAIPPRSGKEDGPVAIEATGLTMRFGDFTAVDKVSLRVRKGEIFGFLGSNGCGKTTTMKMLTGLLTPSEGEAFLFGHCIDPRDIDARRRVGYMSQFFSLYSELTVVQNLELHARLYGVPAAEIPARAELMLNRFGLSGVRGVLPLRLPLGMRQRLSLAVAVIHEPDMLILDEPTSGVDPIARDRFWQLLADLSRRDGVTIFISTHYMNEAERCDRISFMHAGRVLAEGSPAALKEQNGAATLEQAFISSMEAGVEDGQPGGAMEVIPQAAFERQAGAVQRRPWFSLARTLAFAHREALELRRDPIRLTLALVGSVLLMFVMGYGISLDVKDLRFAVLDRDQTVLSQNYALNLAGSRYFIERPPITSYDELDRRMRSGELSLALEIPAGFARDIARGKGAEVGAWIDGAMPMRAETVRGYVQGMHVQWLQSRASEAGYSSLLASPVRIETRFRYNPDVASLVAMVPAVIPLLLMLIPAMLAVLSIVREKELGSIINFYVAPSTRLEFLLGKQLPYIALSMASFLLLTLLAVTVFGVPLKGSLAALSVGALLYIGAATAMGLLMSCFMRSQIAAIFGTALVTIIPAARYSGMIDPVSSLDGGGRIIGEIYPTTYFLTISRGAFSKALGFSDLAGAFPPLLLAVPVLLMLAVLFLRKQEA